MTMTFCKRCIQVGAHPENFRLVDECRGRSLSCAPGSSHGQLSFWFAVGASRTPHGRWRYSSSYSAAAPGCQVAEEKKKGMLSAFSFRERLKPLHQRTTNIPVSEVRRIQPPTFSLIISGTTLKSPHLDRLLHKASASQPSHDHTSCQYYCIHYYTNVQQQQ